MDDQALRLEMDGAIGRLVIDRPAKKNAVTLAMWRTFPDRIRTLVDNPDVRVIVIEGAGGEAFSAGADIAEFDTVRATTESVAVYDTANEAAYAAVRGAAKPVIARIEGFCMGGGFGLALACDMRIASPGSVFAIPAARLGIGYPAAWVADLLRVVPAPVAKDILFTARRIGADEALRLGLVNAVHDDTQAAIATLASQMAANAPLSLLAAKRVIDSLSARTADPDVERYIGDCFASEDYREGRRAFLEKRPARFTGR